MVRLLSVALLSIVAMFLGAQMLMTRGADAPRAPAGDQAARKAGVPGSYYSGDRTVLRRENGQFYLPGQVNGAETRFLVDTGADIVALTPDDAAQLGIDVNPDNFQPVSRTASGTGYGEAVTIDSLEVAGRQFSEVNALVIDGLETNLLGQSVLRRLGRIEMRGEQLVIEH